MSQVHKIFHGHHPKLCLKNLLSLEKLIIKFVFKVILENYSCIALKRQLQLETELTSGKLWQIMEI